MLMVLELPMPLIEGMILALHVYFLGYLLKCAVMGYLENKIIEEALLLSEIEANT